MYRLKNVYGAAVLILTCSTTQAAEVDISGVSSGVNETIQQHVQSLPEIECSSDTTLFPLAYKEAIQNALDAHGYFFADIHPQPLVSQEQCPKLRINVATGQKARVRKQSVQVSDPSQTAALDFLVQPFAAEADFDPQNYERSKRVAIARLRDNGYLDAQWQTTQVAIREDQTADITWVADTGPRYVVNRIVDDQQVLDDTLFQRYLTLKVGEPLASVNLVSTHTRLRDSGYFKRVDVAPVLAQRQDGKVPVAINVEAADAYSFLVGGGFATDTGPRVRSVLDFHRLNAAGHRANVSSMFSPVRGDVSAEYRWPYGDPQHEWYGLTAAGGYEDTDSINTKLINVGFNRTQRVWRHWNLTLFTSLQFENYSVGDVDDRSQLLFAGANIAYTTSLDAARPKHGRSLNIEVKGAQNGLLSDQSIYRIAVRAKQILPLPYNSRLILRANLGRSWQDDFDGLPASLRFFAGGDQSVRGFALDALGDEDQAGDVIGGDKLLTGSVELDFPIRPQWSLAVFMDAGSAHRNEPSFGRSVGVGARWYSPLGPIRLDLAHPLNRSSQPARIHISIGADL